MMDPVVTSKFGKRPLLEMPALHVESDSRMEISSLQPVRPKPDYGGLPSIIYKSEGISQGPGSLGPVPMTAPGNLPPIHGGGGHGGMFPAGPSYQQPSYPSQSMMPPQMMPHPPMGPPPMGPSMGPSMGAPMGPSMGAPMGPSMGAPMGPSMGAHMGPSMGGPMGPSMGGPMGPSMGAPMGVPMGPPMGQPMGPPMAPPMAAPPMAPPPMMAPMPPMQQQQQPMYHPPMPPSYPGHGYYGRGGGPPQGMMPRYPHHMRPRSSSMPLNFHVEGVLQYGQLTTIHFRDKMNSFQGIPEYLRHELMKTYGKHPVTDVRLVAMNGQIHIYANPRKSEEFDEFNEYESPGSAWGDRSSPASRKVGFNEVRGEPRDLYPVPRGRRTF